MPALANALAMLRRIFRGPPPRNPKGAFFKLLARLTPLDEFRVVLDVGANVGEMTARYLEYFPNALVCSIEPVSATCEVLRARFADEPRVQVRQEALGDNQYTALMQAAATSVGNMIVDREDPGGHYVRVSVKTGDALLAETGRSIF